LFICAFNYEANFRIIVVEGAPTVLNDIASARHCGIVSDLPPNCMVPITGCARKTQRAQYAYIIQTYMTIVEGVYYQAFKRLQHWSDQQRRKSKISLTVFRCLHSHLIIMQIKGPLRNVIAIPMQQAMSSFLQTINPPREL
jgi:hypothetical protein